jgi:DNA-binding LacI/PurR family transcriptional regulator
LASETDAVAEAERTLEVAAAYDGLILLSGVFSHGIHGLLRLAQGWTPRPAVSIGYRLPGVPTLFIDNRTATRLATSHLINVHGRKQLLYLRGRRNSREAEDRYLGFRHALQDRGILHDERCVLDGGFTSVGAIEAMANLDPDVEFDGVVAANDDMALAVLTDLRRRGKRVPEDVAVIGFDDVADARLSAPPLASVAQPFAAFAQQCFRLLTAQIAGEPVPAMTEVPVLLVPRGSCGC